MKHMTESKIIVNAIGIAILNLTGAIFYDMTINPMLSFIILLVGNIIGEFCVNLK